MAQQRGMKRAEKVLKRKQKTVRLQHKANVRREERGPVASAPAPAAPAHDHDHEGHDHEHEPEEKKAKKKAPKKKED